MSRSVDAIRAWCLNRSKAALHNVWGSTQIISLRLKPKALLEEEGGLGARCLGSPETRAFRETTSPEIHQESIGRALGAKMRSPEDDMEFLHECKKRMHEVLWPSGRNETIVDSLSREHLAPLIEWVGQQGNPFEGEPTAPILPGGKAFFTADDVDKTTRSLFDGAFYVDGGGRGLMPVRSRGFGDCMFVSVASLAFGRRCSTRKQAEAYSLPLRAAMVRNSIAKIDDFIAENEYFRTISFYDAFAFEGVSLGGEASQNGLKPEQARVALLWTIWSTSSAWVPCPLSCVPLIADALGLGIRVFHPEMTLGSAMVPRTVYDPLHGLAAANEPPLLLSFTLCSARWREKPFSSLYEYKEQCYTPENGRYEYKEFSHVVPVLPPLDIVEQMDKERQFLGIENEAHLPPEAHVISPGDRDVVARQTEREAKKGEKELLEMVARINEACALEEKPNDEESSQLRGQCPSETVAPTAVIDVSAAERSWWRMYGWLRILLAGLVILLLTDWLISPSSCGLSEITQDHGVLLPGDCLEAEDGYSGLLAFLPGVRRKARLTVGVGGGTYQGPDGRKVPISNMIPAARKGPGMLCGAEHLVRQVAGKDTPEGGAWLSHGSLVFGQGFFCHSHATPGPQFFANFPGRAKAEFDEDGHLQVVSGSGALLWSAAPDKSKGSAREGQGRDWNWVSGLPGESPKEDVGNVQILQFVSSVLLRACLVFAWLVFTVIFAKD